MRCMLQIIILICFPYCVLSLLKHSPKMCTHACILLFMHFLLTLCSIQDGSVCGKSEIFLHIMLSTNFQINYFFVWISMYYSAKLPIVILVILHQTFHQYKIGWFHIIQSKDISFQLFIWKNHSICFRPYISHCNFLLFVYHFK